LFVLKWMTVSEGIPAVILSVQFSLACRYRKWVNRFLRKEKPSAQNKKKFGYIWLYFLSSLKIMVLSTASFSSFVIEHLDSKAV